MIRRSSMVNLLNEDDWKMTYTEPRLHRAVGRNHHVIDNIYSISTMALHPIGMQTFSHFNKWRRVWEYLIFFVSFVPLFEVPFYAVINPKVQLSVYLVSLIFDAIFIVDLYVSVNTSFLLHGVVVSDKKKIFKRYGKKSFIIHIIASIPLGWIGILMKKRYIYAILSINKLLRLKRSVTAVETIRKQLVYSNWASTIVPLFVLLGFFIHFFACMLYIIADIETIEQSWIGAHGWENLRPEKLYIICIYFVMTTILTIGYGELAPRTSPETILVIFIQLIGVMIYALILSYLVNILIDPIGNEFLARFDGLVDFLNFKMVDKKLQHDIKDYLQMKWGSNHGTEDPENIYKFIPETIRDKLKRDICLKCFSKVSFLSTGNQRLYIAIADLLQDVRYVPGEYITKQGDKKAELILLSSGVIQIIVDDTPIAMSSCDDGLAIGEQDLFVDVQKDSSIKASTYVEGWSISRESLIHCLTHRPHIRKYLLKNTIMLYPHKSEEIRTLLSGRKMKAELERERKQQRQIMEKIFVKNRSNENYVLTESDSSASSGF